MIPRHVPVGLHGHEATFGAPGGNNATDFIRSVENVRRGTDHLGFHLLEALELVTQVLEVELVLSELGLEPRRLLLVDDLLGESRLASAGYLDPAAVRRLIDEHRSNARNHRKVLWTLLSFELWREARGV